MDHATPDSLPTALHDAVDDCVVVDCETTGLSPADDRIVEIAAVTVRQGRVTGSFHTLVDPGQTLPPVIADLTGLTDSALSAAPTADTVLPALTEFLDGHTVVGHNIDFDISFIAAECARTRAVTFRPPERLCTAASARQLIPRSQVGRYRLVALADRLGLAHRPSHRAATDVLATVDLLNHLDALSHGGPLPQQS